MGVSSCILITRKDDVTITLSDVYPSISNMLRSMGAVNTNIGKNFPAYFDDRIRFSIDKSSVFGNVPFQMEYQGETIQRQLSVHLSTSSEYPKQLGVGLKTYIWISTGCWGNNKEIMEGIVNIFKYDFNVWYDENDCDNVDFIKQE